jgi:glycosyltransferase involved in cell wall biosynthesis
VSSCRTPLISIITPAYNAERFIGQAIESCLSQTHDEFELIIVNDGSTDGTAAVVSGYDDPRIRLIHFDRNRGPGPARNASIRAALGDWITVLDADDLYHRERLQLMLDESQRHGCETIYFDSLIRWDSLERPPKSVLGGLVSSSAEGQRFCELAQWIADGRGGQPFFHRDLLKASKAQYPSTYAAQDTIFFARLAHRSNARIWLTGFETYIYCRTPGSLSQKSLRRFTESERAYGELAQELEQSARLLEAVNTKRRAIAWERADFEARKAVRARGFRPMVQGRVYRFLSAVAVRLTPTWLTARRSQRNNQTLSCDGDRP